MSTGQSAAIVVLGGWEAHCRSGITPNAPIRSADFFSSFSSSHMQLQQNIKINLIPAFKKPFYY